MTSKTATVEVASITLPAGEYYVGDPCYAVPDERWQEWLDAADYMTERRWLLADLDDRAVLGIGTAHGDGVYEGSDGFSYGVDAGLIGLVPAEIADASMGTLNGMSHVTFDRPVLCTYSDDEGTITIGHIVIKTDADPEVEDEDEWEEDE